MAGTRAGGAAPADTQRSDAPAAPPRRPIRAQSHDPRGCQGSEGPRGNGDSLWGRSARAERPVRRRRRSGWGAQPIVLPTGGSGNPRPPPRPKPPTSPTFAPRRPGWLSPASPFPWRGPPCSALPPHVAGAGAGEECWLQDVLAAVSADLDPSIQTGEYARPAPAPALYTPEPAGARSARGLGGSGGVVGGEGSADGPAQLSAGERRGLGLCLLRERQSWGGAAARAPPPPPGLRTAERVPGMHSRRATGPVISTQLWRQPPGFTGGSITVLIRGGSFIDCVLYSRVRARFFQVDEGPGALRLLSESALVFLAWQLVQLFPLKRPELFQDFKLDAEAGLSPCVQIPP
ncbi:wiskott-Aldrich syndrome protein homolog 1-like [Phacochoerus africanus]|uniref:wiskott-Aldrich syndrome protein homolog 1-like n=1 Tax=Phacochoerus africanus TaxID=41426 RepID=UPI001FD8BF5C|nr:wiskott-Aldrich syndrome protein homolog 1-like [Phacochoerus africanus]